MKDELKGQIMQIFVGIRAKPYSYLKENNDEDKKAKDTKKCVILKVILKEQQRFKSESIMFLLKKLTRLL